MYPLSVTAFLVSSLTIERISFKLISGAAFEMKLTLLLWVNSDLRRLI